MKYKIALHKLKTRPCAKCGKRHRRRNGNRLQAYCKKCHAAQMRDWRKTYPLGEEERLRDICRSYANVYKKRGKLVKKPCLECGSKKSQMHHEDYSRPLDVMWLCRPCHMKRHLPA